MITKYRKRGVLRWFGGWGMVVFGCILAAVTSGGEYAKLGGFLGVVLGILGYMLFLFGCTDLLKAKGYDSSVFMAFVVTAFCCSGAVLLMAPFVILYGLKDKTEHRSRR